MDSVIENQFSTRKIKFIPFCSKKEDSSLNKQYYSLERSLFYGVIAIDPMFALQPKKLKIQFTVLGDFVIVNLALQDTSDSILKLKMTFY